MALGVPITCQPATGTSLAAAVPMIDGPRIYIGTAGWQLPKALSAGRTGSTQLQRYADVFNAVEINSTFYRPHRPGTFERWAASVPADFRFAVKMHRGITHERRLRVDDAMLDAFTRMIAGLGDRSGPILVQLPPSLVFDATAADFLERFRARYAGEVVIEPRHRSWAGADVDQSLKRSGIARVAADPPRFTEDAHPGGDRHRAYFRWHGSPRIYRSAYGEERLRLLAEAVRKAAARGPTWVIFDNTADGAAAPDALALKRMLGSGMDRPAIGNRRSAP